MTIAAISSHEPFSSELRDRIAEGELKVRGIEEIAHQILSNEFSEDALENLCHRVRLSSNDIKNLCHILNSEQESLVAQEFEEVQTCPIFTNLVSGCITAAATVLLSLTNCSRSYISSGATLNSVGFIMMAGSTVYVHLKSKKNKEIEDQIKQIAHTKEILSRFRQEHTHAVQLECFLNEWRRLNNYQRDRDLPQRSVSSLDKSQKRSPREFDEQPDLTKDPSIATEPDEIRNESIEHCLYLLGQLPEKFQGDNEKYSRIVTQLVSQLPEYHALMQTARQYNSSAASSITDPLGGATVFHIQSENEPKGSVEEAAWHNSFESPMFRRDPIKTINSYLKEKLLFKRDITQI